MRHLRIIFIIISVLCVPAVLSGQEGASPSGVTWKDPATGMVFVRVDGGCFSMGDIFGNGDSDETPVLDRCVDSFYMGKYEVTQGQWQAIMGYNPSYNKSGADYPVEWVSWGETREFIDKLIAVSGKKYRLPTEAEWEYAARSGGKNENYAGGGNIDLVAWYNGNSGLKIQPVGTKQANGLGIHDMSGNVWEWCQDWYGRSYDQQGEQQWNPKGPAVGSVRVSRGGGWDDQPRYVRAANRGGYSPGSRSNLLGFRLVMPVSQ